jgi:hypothetical protein
MAAMTVAPPEGVIAGRGIDTFNWVSKNDALADTTMETSGGEHIDYEGRVIEDRSELNQALELSAEASFEGFGASVSGKAKFGANQSLNTYSVYFLYKLTVQNSEQKLAKATMRLDKNAKALLEETPPAQRAKAFFKKYGDQFVKSMKTGGELIVLYEFATSSAEDKREITAEVRAAFEGRGESSADFAKKIKKLAERSRTTFKWHSVGGEGSRLPEKPSPAELGAYAADFPQKVSPKWGGTPNVYAVTLGTYEQVTGFPLEDLPFADNRDTLNQLAGLMDRVRALEADNAYVEKFQSLFGLTSIGERKKETLKLKDKIVAAYKKLLKDPTVVAPDPSDLATGVKALEDSRPKQAAYLYGPTSGDSNRGVKFDDAAISDVRASREIRKIMMRWDENKVYSVQFFYRSPDGSQQDFSPGRHGGDGGQLHEVELKGLYVWRIYGRYNKKDEITQLKFHLTARGYVPFRAPDSEMGIPGSFDWGSPTPTSDQEKATYFSIEPPKDFKTFALYGTADEGNGLLRSLGAVFTAEEMKPPVAGTYTIENLKSGKVLDVAGASISEGADIVQWDSYGGPNQKWTLTPEANGFYVITDVKSQLVLGVAHASRNQGARLVQWALRGGSEDQRWKFAPSGSHWIITNWGSGLVLDIQDGSESAGARATQWTANGGNSQRWTLVPER